MYPVLFNVGPFPVMAYGFFVAVGVIVGIAVVMREARRIDYNPDMILDLALYMVVAGVAGSRLAYVAIEWERYVDNPWAILQVWEGGLSFFGALGLCLLVVIWFTRRRRIRLTALGDLLALGVAAGYPFGRIGCFLNGCCYGLPTAGWWGVAFPFDEVVRHPTQLYSAGFGVLIFLFLWVIRGRKPFDGYLMLMYLILYSAYRFIIDFWRTSPPSGLEGLTLGQAVSLTVIALSLFALWRVPKRNVNP